MSKLTLSPAIYARVRRHWLPIRAIKGQECVGEYEAVACVAVRGANTEKVIVSGGEALALSGQSDVALPHAFTHPRVFVAGVDDTVMVVRQFIQNALGGRKPFLPFPIVFHVEETLERAGASRAVVSQNDHALSDAEVVKLLKKTHLTCN